MNLYEISANYQRVLQDITDCDELTHEQLQALESVDDSMQDKAKSVGAFIKNLEADYMAIQEAVKAMEERAIKINNKIENLKEYLKYNLERCEIKEVKTPYFDIKIKTNPASVIISDERLIPTQYFKEQILRRLDKTLVSQELKNNVNIPGVILEKRTRIEIR